MNRREEAYLLYRERMLVSLEERIVWADLGQLEVALHSLGLLVFSSVSRHSHCQGTRCRPMQPHAHAPSTSRDHNVNGEEFLHCVTNPFSPRIVSMVALYSLVCRFYILEEGGL